MSAELSPVLTEADKSDLVEISVPAMWEDQELSTPLPFSIPRKFLQYDLKPQHVSKKLLYLNAQDPRFYHQVVQNPVATVWLLTAKEKVEAYVKRRLFEEALRLDIQLLYKVTHKFDLIADPKTGLRQILYEGKPVELPDCVIQRVGAGIDYFGLAVIRQLEEVGVAVFNKLEAIEVSRDKLSSLQRLAAHGLPIPKTLVAKFPLPVHVLKKHFEFPVIVKKTSGTQGKGIIKVESLEQLQDLEDMLDVTQPLVIQEFIKASSGRDLRVMVFGGKVIGSMMRIASKGFKANVHQGAKVVKVDISPAVEWLCLETVKIIGLDFAGVDLLIDNDGYKICEINSSPGFQGLEHALQLNIGILMFKYIKFRLGALKWSSGRVHKIALTMPIDIDVSRATDTSITTMKEIQEETCEEKTEKI